MRVSARDQRLAYDAVASRARNNFRWRRASSAMA